MNNEIKIKNYKCYIRKMPGIVSDFYHCGYIELSEIENEIKLRKAFVKFEEITYDENNIIGFDTAHVYNTPLTSSYEYVKSQLELIIDEYLKDAKDE